MMETALDPLDALLGIEFDVKVLVAGFSPSSDSRFQELAELFFTSVLDCALYGRSAALDKDSNQILTNFLKSRRKIQIIVIGRHLSMTVERSFEGHAILITEVSLNA